ncbi:MAG: Methyltransferase family protein [Berkelbacteria bacterium GW2011_GWA1_36_9]|uniref:Methyltransferase family protein n=1 Tax=Berkelbacteria bacterium GW2011_GWA1_36_9 TaxID=1618331 RepID=A0A0G0FKC3_9BACT|nr:MAG: Methyltransferase family protein [Berkelbacteria bacterium GW2011_GWA1_36_9]
MNISKCAICNQNKFKKTGVVQTSVWERPNLKSLKRKNVSFVLAKCLVCEHQMLIGDFTKTNLNNLYKSSSQDFTPQVVTENPQINIDILKSIEKYVTRKKATIVDFGCGDLSLLKLIKNKLGRVRKVRLIGVDFVKPPYILDGIDYFQANLLEMDKNNRFKNLKFDYGFLVHSLEHILQPRKLLTDIRSLMNEKSLLYIEVPDNGLLDVVNLLSLDLITPQHIQYFDSDSLTSLITSNGFQLLARDSKITNQIPRLKMIVKKKSNIYHQTPLSKAVDRIEKIIESSANIILTISHHHQVAVWGIGADLDRMIKLNKKLKTKIERKELILFDSYLWGKKWFGNQILNPGQFKKTRNLKIILTPLAAHVRKDIFKNATLMGFNKDQLIDPYQ